MSLLKKLSLVAGVVGLGAIVSGCHPERFRMNPDNQAISNITYDTLRTAAQGGLDPKAYPNTGEAAPDQPIIVIQSQFPHQLMPLETCYKVIDMNTGEVEKIFPWTDSGGTELDNYLTAKLSDRHKRQVLSIFRGELWYVGTCYLDENGRLVETKKCTQNVVK